MSRLASYFTKADRKKLFFDYLKLIGILEIVIFIVVALWSSDDKYHRVYTPFPWKEYLFVAFAFPIVFTFLMGVIITGFNYFLGEEPAEQPEGEAENQLDAVVRQVRRLPLLAILFLLLVTVLALYHLDYIMSWLASLGHNTFILLSWILAGLGLIVTIYMIFFLFFKYRLNQRQMKYQYYSEISERHGLIILDDRTVIHKSGNLLVQGRRFGRPRQVGEGIPVEPELPPPDASGGSSLPAPKSR
jgi:preprotein translocase subunit YajC